MKSFFFKKEMYDAIVAGRKTQTRRIDKTGKPRYKVGDIVYVREPMLVVPGEPFPIYLHDGLPKGLDLTSGKRISPLHMKQEDARVFLRVTGVKHERLQSISEYDAIAEGVEELRDGFKNYKNYMEQDLMFFLASVSFRTLWQSIHGIDSWHDNPLVWAYTFETCEKP